MMKNALRRLPLYVQIKSVLIERIGDGEWQSEQALPSEWELAGQLQVSQGTVRKALGELVAQGVLYRRQGRGTFVAEVPSDWGRGWLVTPGLLDETPDALALELLGCSRVNASVEVAQALKVRRGAELIRVRQLWRMKGQPVAYDDALLPAEPYDELDARALRQCGSAVYKALQRHYGVLPHVVSEQLRGVLINKEQAVMLGVAVDTSALSILRLSAAVEGEPVEWRQRICLTEHFAYTVCTTS